MSTEFASPKEPLFVTKSGISVFDCGDYFRFTLPPTDGTSGGDWVYRLQSSFYVVGRNNGNYAPSVLRSPCFKSTNGVTTEVVVLKSTLFSGNERRIENICAYADRFVLPDKRKLSKLNAETSCIIRENLTDNEITRFMRMDTIIVMLEPTTIYGISRAIFPERNESFLLKDRYDDKLHNVYGYAFAVS